LVKQAIKIEFIAALDWAPVNGKVDLRTLESTNFSNFDELKRGFKSSGSIVSLEKD
jgi:hypothetical protein